MMVFKKILYLILLKDSIVLKNKEDFLPLRKNQIYTHNFKSIPNIGNNTIYSELKED